MGEGAVISVLDFSSTFGATTEGAVDADRRRFAEGEEESKSPFLDEGSLSTSESTVRDSREGGDVRLLPESSLEASAWELPALVLLLRFVNVGELADVRWKRDLSDSVRRVRAGAIRCSKLLVEPDDADFAKPGAGEVLFPELEDLENKRI